MWQRFRQYLPFSILHGQKSDDKNKQIEEEEDERREETSFDATPVLLSDEEEETSGGNFSSTRSSFRRSNERGGGSSPMPKTHQRTASNVEGQQPPKGKFFKRSETAPRSSTSGGGGGGSFGGGSVGVSKAAKKQQQQQKRPFSATPRSEGGDAPNSTTENLTSRLSRRSSIISDLVALMVRRSSSMGHRGSGQQKGGGSSSGGGDQREELSSQDQKERSVDSREEERRLRRNDQYNGEEEEEEDIGNMPREKILQRIRHHKEIIGKVRLQPWPMRRKRRALKVARQYLQRQEAQVSKWHLYKVEASRRTNQAWRWAKNLSIYLIPWESKIKQIESNFGSVVSSFFIFLRWVLGMNVANSLLVMAFVVVPEWLADSKNDIGRFNRTRHIKAMPTKVAVHADELNTVLDFGGYLQYSYLFYGYYSHETVLKGFIIGYHVPVAYVFLNLFLLVFCIFIILKKMTSNTRKSKLSSGKQEQYVFTWKAINGWDYNIGEPETAASLAMANAIKLKEASTEYKKKFKQKLTFQKVFVRVVVNLIITSMMFLSMLAIYKVAQITEKDTFLKQNAVSITVGAITLLFPPIFELILKLELYRPRTALRVHLFRVLFFYLLNYFTLVYSLFIMLNTLEAEMRANEMWKREQQKMDSMTLNSLAASQYQFHIARSPTDNDWNNQSYYEVVSSPFINSKEIVSQFNSQQQQQGRPPFLLFASVSATQSGERRRDKRFFPFLFKSRVRSNKVSLHPKRKKRPKSNSNDGPKERDLSVLYGSNPFPGHELASTTPTPLPRLDPWTTVQPHFGPLFVGVSNPKAIVLPGDRVQQELGTFWESRKIGKGGGNGGNWPTPAPHPLNYTSSPKIRPPITQPYRASNYDDLCWETLIGQEVAKIVTTDLVMTVAAVMVIDFLRGLWIRYCSDWWCWDIEATFPEYGEFKVAENVLHLVNSQAMVCLGTILVPMLPLINCVKLVAVMYIRAWACMVCNVPAKQIFRASRSSNFYFWLLLAFVCMSTLPVGFVIAYKRPSKNCGPFAGQERFYSIIGKVLRQHLPKSLVEVISYFMSPGIIFPVFLILVLVIYFLVLLVSGLRAANSDLNKQLTLERTEEKRRIFELAKGKQHLAGISHKHRPSGESRKSGNGNGTTNGKINGGIEENDGLGFGKKEFNKNGKDGGGPLFFTNGSTTKTPSTTGLRKSWHGGTGGGGSGGTELSGGGTDKDFLTPFLTPKRRSPILRQYSDDSSGSSPSKSPLRHAGFLPSLASVDENEDEENEEDEEEEDDEEEEIVHGHAEAMIFRRKRSNASSQQGISSRRSSAAVQQQQRQRRKSSSTKSLKTTKNLKEIMKRPSLQLTWKDRFLLCIGWTDPIKFEEKLRAQMAENEMEKGRELGGSDEQQPLLFNGERRNKTKREKQLTTHQQLVVLEEAEYSVPSGEEEEAVGDNQLEDVEETTISPTISPTIPQEENAKIDIRKKYLNGILSGDNNSSFDVDTPIRLPSALSQGSNSSCSRVSQQQPPNVIVNKLADLYEEHPPPHSGSCSSSSSIETGSQRSWVRQQPQASNLLLHFGQLPQTNEQKFEENRQSFEREHVSESSPLVPHVQFPSEELARLSIDKRHPLPKEDIQRGSLPPLIPRRKPTTLTYGQQQAPTLNLQQNLFSRGDIRSQTANTSPQILRTEEQQVNQMNGSSSNLVLPSDLSLLLEEPSTPIGNFRPIQASEMFGESFDNKTPETASSITTNTTSTSGRSDPRLQYANPYSSYAAAMCSPIEIPLEETPPIINNGRRRRSLIPSTPPQQQQQYIPQKNPLYIHPLATSSLQFLQRKATPPAIFSSKFEQEHLKQKEMAKMFHFTPQQQKKQNSSPFPSSGNDSFSLDASTSAATTKIPQHSNSLLKTKSQSPKSSILYDDNKNLSAIQRRRKQFASAFEQVPIYDQPTQQPQQYYYRSPYLLTLGDEGGSTSGRGTMPPGGYGSSPQTSESSPEFGHSKYKISSLSPGRQRREQEMENYVDSSTTSPEGSPPKRRFEIRQRSGLGLGGGIPTGNFNNSNNDKKKRDDKTPLDIKQSIV